MTRIFSILFQILVCVFIYPTSLSAQYNLDSLYQNDEDFKSYFNSIKGSFSLFDKEEPLKIILTSDFKNLQKKKYQREYQEATMKIFINDTLEVTRNLKIQPRGKNRLQTCFYPPLKLNFKKGEMLLDEMKEFNKIKLVKPCKGGALYEEFLINEYLIYKTYQLLEPDYNFRVRRLEVTYVDTSGKLKASTVPSFIIENNKQVAKRTNSVLVETEGLGPKHFDRFRSDVLAVFQYMIGNVDWSVAGLHNMKIVKTNDPNQKLAVAIPYDFDYSGIINAPYAVPPEKLNMASVRERMYRGFCGVPGDIEKAVDLVKTKKEEIIQLYENGPFKNERYKEQAIKYLNDFFVIVENERRLKSDIIASCR